MSHLYDSCDAVREPHTSADRSEVVYGRPGRARVLKIDRRTSIGQEQGSRLQGPLKRQGHT